MVSIKKPVVRATYRAAFEQPDALAALLRRLGRSEQAMAAEYQAEQLTRQYRELTKGLTT